MDQLKEWNRPYSVRVNHSFPVPSAPNSAPFFASGPVSGGNLPLLEGPGQPVHNHVPYTPLQAGEYTALQGIHQRTSRDELAPEQIVNAMRIADFMDDRRTLEIGRDRLLQLASPEVLKAVRPFLNELAAVKVPDQGAAEAFVHRYIELFPDAEPACARKAAQLSAILLINLPKTPAAAPMWLDRPRCINDEIMKRLDSFRPQEAPSFPPAGKVSAFHDQLRLKFRKAPPDLLLAASMHHAHAAVSLPPAALMAEERAIRSGLEKLGPEDAGDFTRKCQDLRAASQGYAGFVHPLEFELRGLPDQMARAAKPEKAFPQDPLSDAVLHGDFERARVLLQQGVQCHGYAAVVEAAWRADARMLELLLSGMNPEPSQLKAAWKAVEDHGDAAIARILLDKGALTTPVLPGTRPARYSEWEDAFIRTTERGRTELAQMLLTDKVGPNARKEGFLTAAQRGNTGVLTHMLEDSDPSWRDTAVFMAAAHGRIDAARIIRDAGITPQARQKTLDLAVRKQNPELVELFRTS